MSRNPRQPSTRKPPAKAAARQDSDSDSSLLSDLSSDNGYSAVEDISDNEDDDEDGVEKAEAAQLIVTYQDNSHDDADSSQPEDEDEYEGDGEDDGDDDVDDDLDIDHDFGDLDSSLPSDLDDRTPEPGPAPRRRVVRFAGIPDSDSDSTTSENEDFLNLYGDIFVDQANLDPVFRAEIEGSSDDDNSSNFSFYDTMTMHPYPADFHPSDMGDVTPAGSQPATAAPSPELSLDDYESDSYDSEGDTTEEDEPPPRRKQPRKVQLATGGSDSESQQAVATPKPMAVMHPRTGRVVIFTSNQSRIFSLAPETSQGLPDLHNEAQSSPAMKYSSSLMMPHPPSLMMSSVNPLGSAFGDFENFQGSGVGTHEAFFGLPLSDAWMMGMEDDSDYSGSIGDTDPEDVLDVNEFLHFGGDISDEEQDADVARGPFSDDEETEGGATPGRRPSTATSNADVGDQAQTLLDHFDSNPGAVGAFRRNQVTQKMISSDQVTSESLDFSNPYSIGTLRGIKSGSLETVTAPITPIRRPRRPSANEYNRSPIETVVQKRKASSTIGDIANHKRHRSISDVKNLEL